ncbi:hypothetical protein WMY93_013620 [Mugilogobius chulae]|uniref:SPRY-associated domain-containing protein n=1 Tax=Mugilogobius chulae TaxID=88201 RepID=A0AAW0P6K2_9GOBI
MPGCATLRRPIVLIAPSAALIPIRIDPGLHKSPQTRLAGQHILSGCGLSEHSCVCLSSVLGSSLIQELDLSFNHITDRGLHSLCNGLAHSKVQTLRLKGCGLGEPGAQSLSSLLSSDQCEIKSLDLSDNDFGDRGVQCLSEGLSSPHCPLEALNVSLCRVSERGCMFLASALNCGVLRELDLSYNHPGQSGVQLLTALMDDPLCSLNKLSAGGCGDSRIRPGPRKYAVGLTLDPNTAHKDLSLSAQNRTATRGLNPAGPKLPEKFDFWTQVLCTQGLTGRCYWEVEFNGRSCVGVAYKRMCRKGEEFTSHYHRMRFQERPTLVVPQLYTEQVLDYKPLTCAILFAVHLV